MGFRFRKSIKIAPGLKVNLNKRSVGLTIGGKGLHHTVNSRGRRTTTLGLPGTGLSYQQVTSATRRRKRAISAAELASLEATLRRARYCRSCDTIIPSSGRRHPFVNFVMSVLTLGLWLPVWMISVRRARSAKCPNCGGKTEQIR
jgi:hypothetical protein